MGGDFEKDLKTEPDLVRPNWCRDGGQELAHN